MIKCFAGSVGMLLLSLLPNVSLMAQMEEAPKAVKIAFDQMYPNAEEVDWYGDEEEYIFSFVDDTYSKEASFKTNGTWLQTAVSVEVSDLPEAARKLINEDFGKPDYYINLTRMETPRTTQYLVSFETTTKTVSLVFDANGKLLEKSEENFDDDE